MKYTSELGDYMARLQVIFLSDFVFTRATNYSNDLGHPISIAPERSLSTSDSRNFRSVEIGLAMTTSSISLQSPLSRFLTGLLHGSSPFFGLPLVRMKALNLETHLKEILGVPCLEE